MSENFRGVTFAEQSVTPADDAIVRRAILPDGILTGCEISYSGSTLTMAAGYIIACGRTFQHIAAQNWAVVDATSGFARLVLTIDLTKTATEATFNQIESNIEYAAAEDGFVDLEQSDINLSGTRYQIAAAVVSLGTGGITGIVSQLALSRVEGGGGLNFSVVDGLTQPGDPKENMIWVYTEGMTGWHFAAEQPEEMAKGEVWFSTGKTSTIAFNALKKGTVMVYPISAKQMIDDGILVEVTAKIYQNGAWVEWITVYYDKGTEYISFVGYKNSGTGTYTKESNCLYMYSNQNSNGSAGAAFQSEDMVDVTDVKKIIFVVSQHSGGQAACGISTINKVDEFNKFDSISRFNGMGIYEVDVSTYSGEYYLTILTSGYSTACTVRVSEIYPVR